MDAPSMVMTTEPTTTTTGETRLRMTFEEFLAWDYEGGLTEWVNGEVIIFMSASNDHQRLLGFLDQLLGMVARLLEMGEVRIAPFLMRSNPDGPGREPDLLFIAKEHRDRLTPKFLAGPADLVIEIVSDDSVVRDRDEKFFEYEQAGVREYWILDPREQRQRADFFVLDESGRYQPVPIGSDGIYRSGVLPGFWLKVDWLWAPESDPLTALAEIVGTERLVAHLQGGR